MAGRCRSANRLLAGATGRAILGIAAFSQDSACTLAGRDGLPGTQRRTGVGPLRRTALAGLASPRNASEHGLCVFTHRASPGKKNFWCDADDTAADPSAAAGPAHSAGGTMPVV